MDGTTHDSVQAAAPTWGYSGRLIGPMAVAAMLHATQLRKGTNTPYFSHLLGTCAIALEHGANEDEAIAALVHDVLEDVEPIDMARTAVESFGPEVARIVAACTDATERPKPDWDVRKAAIRRPHPDRRPGRTSRLASDKLNNARTIVSDLHRLGAEEVWPRFSGPREKTLEYYESLVAAFAANPEHDRSLVVDLRRTVAEMRAVPADGGPAAATAPMS